MPTWKWIRPSTPIATTACPPAPSATPAARPFSPCFIPRKTEYLYFVARGDGTHIFSRTNKEHERAKRRIKRAQRMQTN